MSDRGNASLLVLAAAAFVILLTLGLADVGIFLIARTKAQTAADAAALAAAAEMIPGRSGDPAGAAERYAGANGAEIRACVCPRGAREARVQVAVPVRFLLLRPLIENVPARARAEVKLRGFSGD